MFELSYGNHFDKNEMKLRLKRFGEYISLVQHHLFGRKKVNLTAFAQISRFMLSIETMFLFMGCRTDETYDIRW